MRKRECIVCLLVMAAGLLLSCDAAQAKGKVSMPQEPITIEGLMPVKFDHVLHRRHSLPCGECHHDSNHEMRTVDDILSVADASELDCKNCHNKEFENPFLQSRENLFHTNCMPCHAVGRDGVRGPRKCKGCHIYLKQ